MKTKLTKDSKEYQKALGAVELILELSELGSQGKMNTVLNILGYLENKSEELTKIINSVK